MKRLLFIVGLLLLSWLCLAQTSFRDPRTLQSWRFQVDGTLPPPPWNPPTSNLFIWWSFSTNVSTSSGNFVTNWIDRINSVAATNQIDNSTYGTLWNSNCVQGHGCSWPSAHMETSNLFTFPSNMTICVVITNQYLENNGCSSFYRFVDNGYFSSWSTLMNNADARGVGGGYGINGAPYGAFVNVNTNASTACMFVLNISNYVSWAYAIGGTVSSPYVGSPTAPTPTKIVIGNGTSYVNPMFAGLLEILIYTNRSSQSTVDNLLNGFSNKYTMTP